MDFILKNLDNNKPREKLLNLYESDSRVFMRIISRLESRFKNILIYFNMQFLDSESIKPQGLYKGNNLDNYIRVFFAPDDFIIWNKLFPFKIEVVSGLLEEEIQKNLKIGLINRSLKYRYIKLILEEADNVALTVGRTFFGLSESFFNFGIFIEIFIIYEYNYICIIIAKEAETLIFLFKHL